MKDPIVEFTITNPGVLEFVLFANRAPLDVLVYTDNKTFIRSKNIICLRGFGDIYYPITPNSFVNVALDMLRAKTFSLGMNCVSSAL